MGCDIHLYIERKINNKWEEFKIDEALLPDDRNYHLFGFLAGVRGEGGHFADRGIPSDTSWKQEQHGWLGDHSFTHATLAELQEAPWEEYIDQDADYQYKDTYFASFIFHVLPRLASPLGFLSLQEEENIRILIGFDS